MNYQCTLYGLVYERDDSYQTLLKTLRAFSDAAPLRCELWEDVFGADAPTGQASSQDRLLLRLKRHGTKPEGHVGTSAFETRLDPEAGKDHPVAIRPLIRNTLYSPDSEAFMQALGYHRRYRYLVRGLVYYNHPGPILIKVVQLYRIDDDTETLLAPGAHLVQVESPCVAQREATLGWTSRLAEIKAILSPVCQLTAADSVDLR